MKRLILVLMLAMGACAAPHAAAPVMLVAPATTPQAVALPASAGRSLALTVWRAAPSNGVILFGHGLGGQPAAYHAIIDQWVAHGFTVVAPLAVDSMAYANRDKFSLEAGFGSRVEDLMIARGYIAQAFAGQKVVLAGHSYGSLFALIGAGAKTPAGAVGGPPVAGVLVFSSPGAIPQLVSADTYASLKAPLMMITGDADTVPGFVANPAAHRLPFDTSPAGDKMLVTFKRGTHDLVAKGDPATTAAIDRLSIEFLDRWLTGSSTARRALTAERSTALYTIERR